MTRGPGMMLQMQVKSLHYRFTLKSSREARDKKNAFHAKTAKIGRKEHKLQYIIKNEKLGLP
jgi:hypothetical protein